jgi:predicted MFS family arabinose efflux permease
VIGLRFFRSPPFFGAITISVVMSASLAGFLFLNTLYLQDLRHFSPLRAGLMIIPLAVGQAVAANLSGRFVASRGARLPLALGGALLAIGGFLLVPLTAHTASGYLLVAYGIFGLGAGMISPAVTNTAVSGLPPDQVGLAGALAASARQFGSSIGVAVTGSIVASTGPAFISSSHTAWAVLGGCGVVALALGVISTSSWAKAAAARNGQRLATAPTGESQRISGY